MLWHLDSAGNCNLPWEQPLSLAEAMDASMLVRGWAACRVSPTLLCYGSGGYCWGTPAFAEPQVVNVVLVGFLCHSAMCLGGPTCPTVEILCLVHRACRCLVRYYSREDIPAVVRGGENTAEESSGTNSIYPPPWWSSDGMCYNTGGKCSFFSSRVR